jgi:hypothetical protein
MKNKTEKREHSSGGIGGVVTFLCIMTVILTVADTLIKIYAPIWNVPFYICMGAIGVLVIFKWFQAHRS